MKKTILLFALLFAAFQPTPASAGDDWQEWSSVTVEKKLDAQWRLIWNPVWRFRDDFSESFYWGSRQGLGYKPTKNLDFAAQYLYLEEANATGNWNHEDRYELLQTLKWNWLDLDWSNRNRLEYRDVVSGGKFRYRNLTKVSKKLSWSGFEFAPYASDEVFFDPKSDTWNQNRFSLGFVKKLNENVSLDLYYLVRSDKTGKDWSEANVLGTTLTFSF